MINRLTKEDLDNIEKSPTNLFHVLRHFSSATEDVVNSLIGKSYEYYDYKSGTYVESVITEEDIERAFKTSGSKFFRDVDGLKNPLAVISFAMEYLTELFVKQELFWEDKGKFFKFEFAKEMEKKIGLQGVVDINDLSEEDLKKVEKKDRGGEGVVLQTLSGKEHPSTRQLAIQLIKRKDTGRIYITAYPGIIGGLPFPSAEQSDVDRKASEEYWSKKVFLE